VKKTDAKATQLLALYLAKGLLPKVRMKDKQYGQIASLTQTRERAGEAAHLVEGQGEYHAFLARDQPGQRCVSSERKLDEVLTVPFDELVRVEPQVIVAKIRSLNRSIHDLDQSIAEGSKLERHKNLTSTRSRRQVSGLAR
jgi:hypothetical protein